MHCHPSVAEVTVSFRYRSMPVGVRIGVGAGVPARGILKG
ncbi:hypothetical protein GA0070604_5111 [Micromonospora eburnea]|uniref:Uncharacterized protein n=1 Tax=Micromonospora eburnea TaxID=227316 RepID=A0A1C6VCG9_9ACTN|nr:hypothetical protein GA0070604_5111 [Micromonospora eburnea]